MKNESVVYVTVYADTTGWFTEEGILDLGNLVDIAMPEELLKEWYYDNGNEDNFDYWFKYESTADDMDTLMDWLKERGFVPQTVII